MWIDPVTAIEDTATMFELACRRVRLESRQSANLTSRTLLARPILEEPVAVADEDLDHIPVARL